MSVEIAQAIEPGDIAEIRRLFVEYAEFLGHDLSFQKFNEEVASLPGFYAPPDGRLLLARVGSAVAGGVGLRPLERGICEMKRLFVRRWPQGPPVPHRESPRHRWSSKCSIPDFPLGK